MSTPGVKRRIAVAAIVTVAGASGVAVARGGPFAALSGGESVAWTVALDASTGKQGAVIYPGGPIQRIPFTITSSRDGQTLRRVAASISAVKRGSHAASSTGSGLPSCAARWFTAVPDPGDPTLPAEFKHAGESYHGSIDVTMVDAAVDQDACRGQSPAVTIAAAP